MRIRFDRIDRQVTPLGTLTLHRYEAETGEVGYEVRIDDAFLMATHGAYGEIAMVELAHRRLPAGAGGLSVLVGGLGAGHTLRAVLDLAAVARVDVVEISSKVVEWNRCHFAEVNGQGLEDPRVTVVCADLAQVLPSRSASYDLMLIDVDNGPGWLATPKNSRLYEPAGLGDCRRALRAGGVSAFWSPQRSPVLAERLAAVFGNVEQIDTATLCPTAPGPSDVILLARRRPGRS